MCNMSLNKEHDRHSRAGAILTIFKSHESHLEELVEKDKDEDGIE